MMRVQSMEDSLEDNRQHLSDALNILGVYKKQWEQVNVIPSTDDESEDPQDSPWRLIREQEQRVDRLRRRVSELESTIRDWLQTPEYPVTSVVTSSDGKCLVVVVGDETFWVDAETNAILNRTTRSGAPEADQKTEEEKGSDMGDGTEDIPDRRFTHLEIVTT